MKKKPNKPAADEMRPEYDIRGGVRGKYYERYKQGTNVVLLEADLAKTLEPTEGPAASSKLLHQEQL